MAHNVIPLSSIQLLDRWPGPVNPNAGIPTNGWDNTVSNFKTTSGNITPMHPIGEKRMAYTDNTHCPGWYTMMYLSYHAFESADVSADFSDSLCLCTPSDQSTEEWYDNSSSSYFVVTNEITEGNSDATRGMRIAFPCATLSSDGTDSGPDGNSYGDSWGWFWIEGVCPCKDATVLDGTVGSGYGVEFACASTFEGGPITLDDFSTDRIYFAQHTYDQQSTAFTGVKRKPILGYGDVSGS